MDKQLSFYRIDIKYIRDLANADDNVYSVSPQTGKQDRPFIGILVMINGREYCAPLTSPKPKHKKMKKNFDFVKVMGKVGDKEDILAVINFNNMIPVHDSVMTLVNLKVSPKDDPQTKKHKILMSNQLKWCRANADLIKKNSQKTYHMVTSGRGGSKLVQRCCDFVRLEQVLDNWLRKNNH